MSQTNRRAPYVWLIAAAGCLVLIAVAIWYFDRSPSDQPGATPAELNLLCWVGYEERTMLEPFERKHNIKVNYKTFVGGDEMFTLVTQSPGRYDVVVVDPEYIEKLRTVGRLIALDPADYNFDAYFEPFRKFPLCWHDGQLLALVVRFGSNGLVYNTRFVTEAEAQSYDILWNPKLRGKIGIWDWYLPSMGVISCALGYRNPYDITNDQFQAMLNRLRDLRPQVAAVHAKPPELLTALANEQTWIVPTGGESWAAILRKQGKPIDWCVPKEGGVMWVEALAILKDAPHPAAARTYLQWMNTAEAQSLLTQRDAYNSNVPNAKAYDLLTITQRDGLKIHNETEALALIGRLTIRRLPVQQTEEVWQKAWQDFKGQ